MIEDYVNHLANYNLKLIYKPDLLFGDNYDYDNRIHLEFNHMYHWHPFNPDEYNISGTVYSIDEFMYHPEMTVKHGMRDFVDSMSRSLAGKVHALLQIICALSQKDVPNKKKKLKSSAMDINHT